MKSVSKILAICVLTIFTMLSTGTATYAASNVVSVESSSESIEKLQTLLQTIGAYTGEIDGEYESVESTIISLQIELLIIKTEDDAKAGIVDATFLNRAISKYKETPERLAELAEEKALEAAIAEEAANKAKNDAAIAAVNQQELAQAAETEPDTGERKFIVTAYYSPLPGQSRYSTGSYWGDIRLNGEGTHGASGAAVYYGFIAAPKNYAYGTKIYLEGFGNGVVEDRGGAIVNAGVRGYEYDRLDIWMGYGDTGLTRALNWGKKTVSGKILSGVAEVDAYETSGASEYYGLTVTPTTSGSSVEKLQELLTKLGYYDGAIDGIYASVGSSLLKYQMDKNVIPNEESNGAGYFGPITLAAAQKDLTALVQTQTSSTTETTTTEQTVEEVIEEIGAADDYPLLSSKEESELKTKANTITEALELKAGGNRITLSNYKKTVIARLEALMNAETNEKSSEQLRYLIENL